MVTVEDRINFKVFRCVRIFLNYMLKLINKSMNRNFSVLIFLLVILSSFAYMSNMLLKSATSDAKLLLNVNGSGQTLQNILGILSHQTGYSFKVEGNLMSVPVYGNFKKIPVGNFFEKVLNGYKYALAVNHDKHEVTVLSLSMSSQEAYSQETINGKQKPRLKNNKEDLLEDLNPNLLIVEELKTMHYKQEMVGKSLYQDQGIDPISGLQLSEIRAIHRNQEIRGKSLYQEQGILNIDN